MVPQYCVCATEGIHQILGRYDGWIALGKIRMYELAPSSDGCTSWRPTPIFDFDDDEGGFWRSVIIPEINQETKRQDILTLVAAREKPQDRNRRNAERQGGTEERNPNDDKPKAMYALGPNLTMVERKLGYARKPLDKRGDPLCYNFSTHAGCAKGDYCSFSHAQRIRPEGLHWAIQYDLTRRGGLLPSKRIETNAVEGYLQALRNQNAADVKKSVEGSRNNIGKKTEHLSDYTQPPGLWSNWKENTSSAWHERSW